MGGQASIYMPRLRLELPNRKPGHTTGGPGRGWAGQGGAGRIAQETKALRAFQGIGDTALDESSEARTNECQCKPMGGQNRFIIGLSVGGGGSVLHLGVADAEKDVQQVVVPDVPLE